MNNDIRDMNNAAIVINPRSDQHVALIRAIVAALPYGNQCENFEQLDGGDVEFKWRNQRFRVNQTGDCDTIRGACLLGDDASILARALIKKQLGEAT